MKDSESGNRAVLPSARWESLHRATFDYFWEGTNPENGLTPDTTSEWAPASIAVTGFGLSAYLAGVERGWISRAEAAKRTRAALRFFAERAAHHEGFFFHFLDLGSGERVWQSEVSSIDSTLLYYGMLNSAVYFDRDTVVERDIRQLAADVFGRADWDTWRACEPGVCLWWKPERGFTRYRWSGFSEGVLVYLLGLGSKSHPLPRTSFDYYRGTFKWHKTYGCEWLYCGPLFTHLFPHLWMDWRVVRGEFDLWENTRNAIRIQREYALRNPKCFAGYGANCWGLSACDGPGESGRGRRRRYSYRARGVPYGPDDGTLSPPVALASLAFDEGAAVDAEACYHERFPHLWTNLGLRGAVNPGLKWICTPCYGLDQGMLCLMLENYRSGLFWDLGRRCPEMSRGVERAGFQVLSPVG